MVHSVLFDPPIPDGQRIDIGNDTIIDSIECIYNSKLFKNMFIAYFAFLLMQYILVYPCVPLEEIENRPAMCVIANIYILVMVCQQPNSSFQISSYMIVLIIINVPTSEAFLDFCHSYFIF